MEDRSQSPRQRIQEIVGGLPQKELQVLTERYGLDGNTPQTLQDIAHRVHVTRERVRQVEAKATRRLQKTQRSRSAFESLLNAEQESAWAALCGDASSLNEARLYEVSQFLDPYVLLAIDVLYVDIREWITKIAHSFPGGWFRNQSDANRLVDFEKAVRSVAEGYATPVTPEQFGEITGLIAGENLVYEGQNWAFFESYLCVGYLGAKSKRLVRMHRIAKAEFPNGMFDICQLARLYRQQYPDDNCGSRIFQMQADDAPHLFAQLFDNISICLPTKAAPSSFVPAPPFERGDFKDDDFAEGTIGSYLANILSAEGPQRQSDLKELVLAAAGDTNIAESSIGVILISNPCFRRVAPGAFALYHGDIELQQKLQPRLLNRTTGSKNDNHDAADVLALLVLAGLARPEADWQIKHIATDLGIETFNRACAERHMCGKLSWENGVLGALFARLEGAGAQTSQRSWISDEESRRAICAWRSGPLPTGKAYGGRQTISIDVEQLFDSDAWNDAFGT
jgi:hypothetical protein